MQTTGPIHANLEISIYIVRMIYKMIIHEEEKHTRVINNFSLMQIFIEIISHAHFKKQQHLYQSRTNVCMYIHPVFSFADSA